MLNIMLTRKYALFEQETKRTDFFFNTLYETRLQRDAPGRGRGGD